jgi:hypothetical protein
LTSDDTGTGPPVRAANGMTEKIGPKAARHEPWARRKRPIKKESVLTDGNQVLRERALEWIAAGLVALFIFSGIVFYSFSVDAEHKRDATKCGGEASHRL